MKKTINLLLLPLFLLIIQQGYPQQKRIIKSSIYQDSIFIDTANFRWVQFTSQADFWKAKFKSLADFQSTEFDTIANFYQAKFIEKANFRWTKYASKAYFWETQFDSEADFLEAEFKSIAGFYNAKFDSLAFFYETQFMSKSDFQFVHFKSEVNFFNARFNSTVSFLKAQFDSKVDLRFVQFADTANFSRVGFNSKVDFNNTKLPKYLDWSHVTNITDEIDLTNSLINPDYDTCYINLTGSSVDKIRFRYKRFKLWFPEDDSIGYELKANVYEELLKKQKEEGFSQSYELLDKEFKQFQYTDSDGQYGRIWGHTLNRIDKNWWGYGYNKELIIRNVILIFLLLSLLNSFFLKYLISNVYANKKIEHLLSSKGKRTWFNRWFDSMRYSIFYTAIIFFSFNFDMEKLNYAGNLDGWKILNLTYFMLIYLGGLVCLAYLANYIITV